MTDPKVQGLKAHEDDALDNDFVCHRFAKHQGTSTVLHHDLGDGEEQARPPVEIVEQETDQACTHAQVDRVDCCTFSWKHLLEHYINQLVVVVDLANVGPLELEQE